MIFYQEWLMCLYWLTTFIIFWPIDLYWISFLKQCLGKLADVVFSAIVVQMPSSILWTFQSWKWLYIHQCPFVCLSVCSFICPQNSLAAWNHHPSFHPSSFILHHLSFIIPHSSFIILHSSFLHFATFKLFSLFFINYFYFSVLWGEINLA